MRLWRTHVEGAVVHVLRTTGCGVREGQPVKSKVAGGPRRSECRQVARQIQVLENSANHRGRGDGAQDAHAAPGGGAFTSEDVDLEHPAEHRRPGQTCARSGRGRALRRSHLGREGHRAWKTAHPAKLRCASAPSSPPCGAWRTRDKQSSSRKRTGRASPARSGHSGKIEALLAEAEGGSLSRGENQDREGPSKGGRP
jgi:hypothetical protein